jgi:hypothetical protein
MINLQNLIANKIFMKFFKFFKFFILCLLSAFILGLQSFYINFKYYPDLIGWQYIIDNFYLFSISLFFLAIVLFLNVLFRYLFIFLYLFLSSLVMYYVANTANMTFKLNPLVVRFVLDTNIVESAEVLGSMLSRFDLGNPLFYVFILVVQVFFVVFIIKLMDLQLSQSEIGN